MTTYLNQTVTCVHCGRESQHEVLGSTNAFGSPDLDLRPPSMERWTMEAWLQQCPHCGYVAPDLSKREGDPATVRSAEYRRVLEDERYPKLARRFLAYALLWEPSELLAAAHSRLKAAWVCDDEQEEALAVECRRWAAETWQRAKPFQPTLQGLSVQAVLVDVLRRSGQFEDAQAECAALLEAPQATGMVRKVAERQQRLIAAEDTAAHTLAEVPYAPPRLRGRRVK